eukprot:TRINITY_DN9761_c1_g1_i2.p1 TRINITY_DN9761_c1_g1~~TRINITY_DN9761_c1_g1_i2.p1  ORF type:complete len:336 (+),score=31.81 TRINITY_DN9761_c1_g1_i2:36-1010(+)
MDGGRPHMSDILISGATAGIISRSVTAPLDRLKTLMALRDAFRETQRVKLSSRSAGVVGGLKMIYREAGITGFWRGNFTNVMKVMPETSIKFLIFESLKPKKVDQRTSQTHSATFLAGATAGIIAQATVYPLDVIKTRLAASETGVYRHDLRYGGMLGHVVNRMLRYEGWRALYKGMGTSLFGIIPYAGVDLLLFDSMKFYFNNHFNQPQSGQLPVSHILVFGMISSFIAQTITYPLGVVRMRLQAQGMTLDRPILFSSPIDCFVKTYQSAGIRGLYSGYIPSLLKVAPTAAITYAVYERCKHMLSERRENRRVSKELEELEAV